jgi:hypothetical protein
VDILGRWAVAEVSSDLQHHEKECDVDILGAVGMASHRNGHVAIYRVKYLNDVNSIPEAVTQFSQLTKVALVRRRFKLKARNLSERILEHWINDVCQSCQGRMYVALPGERLSDRACKSCEGIGKRPPTGEKQEVIIFTDVIERADKIVENLQVRILSKLGKK